MSRSVLGNITLAAVAVTALAGTVDHYKAVFTEAAGTSVSVDVPLNGTAVPVTLEPGVWSATITAVDASGAALAGPVQATVNGGQPGPLVVIDVTVVMVNVPAAFDIAVA